MAGLVLAAGAGTRLGGPKVALRLGGSSFLAGAVTALRDGGCGGPLLAVLAPGVAVPADVSVDVVRNPGWAEGMGSSLRSGLAALAAPPVAPAVAPTVGAVVDAVVVTLVDTPAVGPAHVSRLLDAYDSGTPGRRASLAAAAYGGRRRTPVLLGRDHWAGVAAMARGDVGARTYLEARRDVVTAVECGDLGAWADVDTPADVPRR